MTSPAAITGDYTDLRFVKGRKVCQVVIEIPIEAGEQFVKAFGTPNPATGVPVAIARLDPNATPERKGGKLAQKAGILCAEGGFRAFLNEVHGYQTSSADDAAEAVRELCGVSSRAELDHNQEAARFFTEFEKRYRLWLTVPA